MSLVPLGTPVLKAKGAAFCVWYYYLSVELDKLFSFVKSPFLFVQVLEDILKLIPSLLNVPYH